MSNDTLPHCETPVEEKLSSITHGIGAILSIVALAILVTLASLHGGMRHVITVSVYGGCMLLLYLASTCYHACRGGRAKHWLKVADHIAIYCMIAGTYTPFLLVSVRGAWGWSLFGVLWGLTLLGAVHETILRPPLRFHLDDDLPGDGVDRRNRGQAVPAAFARAGRSRGWWQGGCLTRRRDLLPVGSSAASITRSGTCSCWRGARAISSAFYFTSCRSASCDKVIADVSITPPSVSTIALRQRPPPPFVQGDLAAGLQVTQEVFVQTSCERPAHGGEVDLVVQAERAIVEIRRAHHAPDAVDRPAPSRGSSPADIRRFPRRP